MSSDATATTNSRTYKFGVFMLPRFQLLDALGPIEYLTSHSKSTLQEAGLPAHLTEAAFDTQFFYLSSTGTLDLSKQRPDPNHSSPHLH